MPNASVRIAVTAKPGARSSRRKPSRRSRSRSIMARWTLPSLPGLAPSSVPACFVDALACNEMPGLALVLSGGGARAAYQVGVLRILAREFPEAIPDILTGVSAGGINAAFLAARPEPYQQKIDELAEMWSHLRIDEVFRVDARNLGWRALRWGGRLISGGKSPLPPSKSMVDTKPLREVLERELHAGDGAIEGINASLRDGWLRAFALTASSYTTGQSITWVQTREDCVMPSWERPLRKSTMCALRIDHVMASAALPFFFPAIEVDGAWY